MRRARPTAPTDLARRRALVGGYKASSAPGSGHPLNPPPLRGRADELQAITALVDGIADGRGGVAVIEGPPGIGKSRLVIELMALARQRGVRTLFGEAFEYQRAVPFFPLFTATVHADPPSVTQRRCACSARPPTCGTGWHTNYAPRSSAPLLTHLW
jgi:AAA ATPase domain